MKNLIIIIVAWLFTLTGAYADMPDLDEIIKKSNHAALYQGMDIKGRVTILITDKHGRERKRVFNMLRKNCGGKDQDQKYFTCFKKPADVRKMVFMVHKHTTPGRDDARWLYMPAMDLVKRISAGDKRTSFAGSDFLYEDISGRSIEEDEHILIKTVDNFFIIKNIPKKPGLVEFAYYTVYIDKTNFIPVKIEYFKNEKRIYRTMEAVKIIDIEAEENGKKVFYPTIIKSIVKNLETGGISEMIFSGIQYNTGLSDQIFTERYLRKPPREAIR